MSQSNNPFGQGSNVVLELPTNIKVRLVDASSLNQFKLWSGLASLLSNFAVGFWVWYGQEKNEILCGGINPIFEGVNCDGVTATDDLPRHVINLSLFPNPLEKDEFHVNIEMNNIADVQLEIVNLLGQKVINRDLGTLSIGDHTISCPLPKETPTGNYFVKLYVNEELVTLKLLRI